MIVCYQYNCYGVNVYLKTLYERPAYNMDCICYWRIKQTKIQWTEVKSNLYNKKQKQEDNEQWAYM